VQISKNVAEKSFRFWVLASPPRRLPKINDRRPTAKDRGLAAIRTAGGKQREIPRGTITPHREKLGPKSAGIPEKTAPHHTPRPRTPKKSEENHYRHYGKTRDRREIRIFSRAATDAATLVQWSRASRKEEYRVSAKMAKNKNKKVVSFRFSRFALAYTYCLLSSAIVAGCRTGVVCE